ncbi:hypothetical protein RJ641_009914 [Dillenia turbinata]|uniref:Uncharacterized protein n=1 Tax=Dillenia turbinata TaxID=194707 RepID=A0AAN8Z278_9MAGN
MKSLSYELYQSTCKANSTIVICHGEPGSWYPPLFQTFPCPPGEYKDFMSVNMRISMPSRELEPSKVVKVVQSVDVDFFDPRKYEAIDLASLGRLVFGKGLPNVKLWKKEFFLQVFSSGSTEKEFSEVNEVVRYLLVNAYYSDRNFRTKILKFVSDLGIEKPANGWAPVHVINIHVTQIDLPRIYKSANAFVLPSRGRVGFDILLRPWRYKLVRANGVLV